MMNLPTSPIVSFVLATHNRRGVVLNTLMHVEACGLNRADFEIVVVDNASEDGTPDAAGAATDVLIRLERNAGSCAKAFGCAQARGQFIVFLDDDSYPLPGSIERMIGHFKRDSTLAAAGFSVHLPDGRQECSALPGVFVGCGVGLRADALRQVGGLDPTFFMQAEEYDLCFRLAQAGWRVAVFGDLHVDHLKTAHARRSERTTYYDIRNNLRVAARYLPGAALSIYRADWSQRYAWMAERDGHQQSFVNGLRAGRRRAAVQRWSYRKHRLSVDTFERFFGWHDTLRHMKQLKAAGTDSIVLAGLGKNIYAYHRAAGLAGVAIKAIADERFAAPLRQYRGAPIVSVDSALDMRPDAVVIGNTSYVHARETQIALAERTDLPIHNWFPPPDSFADRQFVLPDDARRSDEPTEGIPTGLPRGQARSPIT